MGRRSLKPESPGPARRPRNEPFGAQTEPSSSSSRRAAQFVWLLRIALLALVVASPWPFGSATYRPMGFLTAALYALFGLWAAYVLVSKDTRGLDRTTARWVAAGVVYGLLQLVPMPQGLLSLLAPASHDIWHPRVAEALRILGDGWHPISIEPFATQAELLRFGSLAAGFFLCAHLFSRRTELRLLAYTVAVAGVALSFFAVYQQARWGTLLYGRFPVPSATPFGPFVNHNHFAGFIEMCGLVTLGAAFGHVGRKSPAATILLGGSAAVMGIALVLSRSRGGLIAAGAGAILLATLALRGNTRVRSLTAAVWTGATALVIAIILLAAPQRVFERLGTMTRPATDVSVQFRLNLWKDSLRLIARSPFVGTGLGTYEAAVPGFRTDKDETRAEHAESDVMEHACETGLVGLILLGGFITAVVSRAREGLFREQAMTRTRGILMGATAAAFALLVHSFFDFNTRVPSNALLLAALLGLVAGAGAVGKPGGCPDPRATRCSLPPGMARRLVAGLLIVLLASAAAWRSSTIGLSRHITWTIDTTLAEPEDFAAIAARLSRAAELAESNPEIAFKRGKLYNEEAYRSVQHERYRDLRFEQARGAYLRAVQQAPARGTYWFELAWTEGNRRQDERADPLFRYAIALEPNWSSLRLNLGLYLASRDRPEEAIGQLAIACTLVPGIRSQVALDILAPFTDKSQREELKQLCSRSSSGLTSPSGNEGMQ